MKKIILSLSLLFLSLVISAQSFVVDGKLWNVRECMMGGACWTQSFKLEGDTTIGQHDYLKYFFTYDTTYINWFLIGAMRQSNDSVFMIDFDYEYEMLLYVFNLQVGDTFNTIIRDCNIYQIVWEIDTIELMNGEETRRIWFYWYGEFWTPELGSFYGPSYMGVNWCAADVWFVTTCAFLNDEQFYQEEYSESCFTYTVDLEENIYRKTAIYPNPFTTSTTIEYQLDQPSEVILSIYNHLGEQIDLIRQHQHSGKQQITWNAVGLPPGMYFFTLQSEDQVATGKMVLTQ